MNPKNGLPIVMRIALGSLLALGAPPAARADEHWTVVGQSASMDETALNPVRFAKSTGGLSRPAGGTGTVIAYWNIDNVSVPDDPTWNVLSLLNYDNSAVNKIAVFLMQIDRRDGTVGTIATMFSSDSASTKADIAYLFGMTWDFSRYSYFIYAHIYGTDTTSQPIIRAVTLGNVLP